ncbi:MAG: hypothetical protein DRI73_10360 [Bacteroidetes bacterium]|nr:MAG: hypothetical protein DRI73_10360 [Bacteroidota bacterium]
MKKSLFIIAAMVVTGFMLQAGQVKAQSSDEKMQKNIEKALQAQEEEIKKQEALVKTYERQVSVGFAYPEISTYDFPEPPPLPSLSYVVKSSEKSFKLSLRKKFDGESITKKTSFTIDKDQKRLKLNAHGSFKEGLLSVKFSLPSGKLFKEIIFDPSADVDWSQSIKIEEDSSIYKGQWHVEIKAVKAKGTYVVDISSY